MVVVRSFSKKIFSKKAFSLLEILIAFSIFIVSALGLILWLRQGSTRGEAFSSEHFTAMFLSQKVLEDINNRVSENPHFFTDKLIHSATGEKESVVDGKSFYFKLLENTQNFANLQEGDDEPIKNSAGSIYNQLRNFNCQIESRFVIDPISTQPFPNLIEVTVNLSWNDLNGHPQKYSLSQQLYGVNEDNFSKPLVSSVPSLKDDGAGAALWYWLASDSAPSPPTFKSFMQFNGGGDPEVVLAVGHLVDLVFTADGSCERYNVQIESYAKLREEAIVSTNPKEKAKAALYQEHIARLFEQKASIQFACVAKFLPTFSVLQSKPIDSSTVGPKIYENIDSFRGFCFSGAVIIDRIPINFWGAEDAYCQLLVSPYKGLFPPRKVNKVIQRLFDVQKLGILANGTWGGTALQFQSINKRLLTMKQTFQGRQPNMVDFLDRELEICKNMASLQKYFGGVTGFSGVINQVMNAKPKFILLEEKI